MLTDADIVLVNNTSNGQKPFRMSYGSYKRLKEKSKYRNTLEIVAETVEPVQKKTIADVAPVGKTWKEFLEKAEDSIKMEFTKPQSGLATVPEEISDIDFTAAAEKLIEKKGIDRAVFIGMEKVGIQDVRNYLK